jgi:hypothetical protein
MICHKCGKSTQWEKLSVTKDGETLHYHIQCWEITEVHPLEDK